MRGILLCSLGSRGDIEPFLALGEELQAKGEEVAFCFPAQFEARAREVSPHFYPQDPGFLQLLESLPVRQVMAQAGSPLRRIITMVQLLQRTGALQQQLIRDQKAAVDQFAPRQIIFHIKCIYPVMLALQTGANVHLLSPVPCLLHPVAYEPNIGFGKPGLACWNLLTYRMANQVLIKRAILAYGQKLAREFGFAPLRYRRVRHFLLHRMPVEYAISRDLFPRPESWPPHVKLSQFRERNKAQHWRPSPELKAFLARNPRPLYIGFGSMVNDRPQQLGRIIVELSQELGQPILANCGWGGIKLPLDLPSTVFQVENIPYDWLFDRISAVVHHGGSGTTHSALRYGLPQLIIPHIADQFLWQRLVINAGQGVAGFPIKKLNKARLKHALEQLLRLSADRKYSH